jgi:hypothetical protein
MKKSSVSEWHRWFKEGRKDVQDDPRSGKWAAKNAKDRCKCGQNTNLGVRLIAGELSTGICSAENT